CPDRRIRSGPADTLQRGFLERSSARRSFLHSAVISFSRRRNSASEIFCLGGFFAYATIGVTSRLFFITTSTRNYHPSKRTDQENFVNSTFSDPLRLSNRLPGNSTPSPQRK